MVPSSSLPKLGILVGHGSYGRVYRAECDGKVVAVKRVLRDTGFPGVPRNACREIGILKELKVYKRKMNGFFVSHKREKKKIARSHCESFGRSH